MADNTSNNDTLVDELSILIPSFGGCEYCVRCFAHILNLVVKVCGFRIIGFIALIILLLGHFVSIQF